MKTTMEKPEDLSPRAEKAWDRFHRILPHLTDADADAPAMQLLAEKWAEWAEAHAQVVQMGMVITQPNGWHGPNPYLSIRTKAGTSLYRMLRDFGITPATPAKTKDTSETDDELEF